MMWGNREQQVFANDKDRGNVLRRLRSVATSFRAQIHAYVRWHTDVWHAVPDTTKTLEEYWHNGHDM
jgi:type II secretory pathway pseudopilin PulG